MKTITIDGVEYNLTPIEKQSKQIILEQTLKFEVYPNYLGNHTWKDANYVCALLGDGWRLPTREELHLMYLNKNEIGGFAAAYYWSSSESYNNSAWSQSFATGSQASDDRLSTAYVRAVRALSI
jgi:hypothetical protein